MPPASPSLTAARPGHTWRQVAAGSNAALGAMATSVTLGLLAYGSLGPLAGQWSLAAVFAALIIGSGVYALLGTVPAPLVSLSSSTTLILATLVAELARDPVLRLDRTADVEALVAVTSAALAVAGLLQVLLGRLGAGTLARQVPQPVLAGFMNGVALLIVLAQLPTLFGLPSSLAAWRAGATLHWQPLALLLGLGTAAAAVHWVPRWPRLPGMLLVLIGGSLLAALATTLWPGLPPLTRLGQVSPTPFWPDALWPLHQATARDLAGRHLGTCLGTAATLAIIGALESLLRARATEQQQAVPTHWPHAQPEAPDTASSPLADGGRRELQALGIANLASALCGGLPVVLSLSRNLLLNSADTQGRVPPLVGAGLMVAVYALAAPLLAQVPHAVLAGVMLAVAVAMADRWTRALLQRWWQGQRGRAHPDAAPGASPEALADLRRSLAQVALVCATTVVLGFAAAVALGVVVSLVMFMRHMNRSLLRSAGLAPPSRRLWGPAQEAVLSPLRRRIHRFELEGALYFGNAEALAERSRQLPADARALVLDLRRVTMLDESGVVQLHQIATDLARRGTALLLAGVAPDGAHAHRLRAYGGSTGTADTTDTALANAGWTLWPDGDRAAEAAEQMLLAQASAPSLADALDAPAHPLLAGLDPGQRARVVQALQTLDLPAGTVLFREGDPGDRLYLVLAGSVSIVRHANGHGRGGSAAGQAGSPATSQRYGSLSPGVLFGEIALLDGAGRSADAVTDTDCRLAVLTRDALDRLGRDDPAIGSALMHRMALHMADRLRRAGDGWQDSAA